MENNYQIAFSILDMTCASCTPTIEKALKDTKGVKAENKTKNNFPQFA